MEERKVQLPLTEETILSLKAGDSVLLTGTMITGRDAAHQRLFKQFRITNPYQLNLRVKSFTM